MAMGRKTSMYRNNHKERWDLSITDEHKISVWKITNEEMNGDK